MYQKFLFAASETADLHRQFASRFAAQMAVTTYTESLAQTDMWSEKMSEAMKGSEVITRLT